MKIDWKAVAASPGYKSIKAALIADLNRKRPHRSKEANIKLFHWVICRAKHYANYENTTLEEILNRWETKRKEVQANWWFGYYSDFKQPRYRKKTFTRNLVKYHKKQKPYGRDGIRKKRELLLSQLKHQAKIKRESLGKKPRWSNDRKKRAKDLREYLAKTESVS